MSDVSGTKRRKRTSNFTSDEYCRLTDAVLERQDVINSSHKDPLTNTAKRRAWQEVANIVSSGSTTHRTAALCRKRFQQRQSNVKGKAAEMVISRSKTGGGPPPRELSAEEQRICETIPQEAIVGISNGVEDSFINESYSYLNDLNRNSFESSSDKSESGNEPLDTQEPKKSEKPKSIQEEALSMQREMISLQRQTVQQLRELNANFRYLSSQLSCRCNDSPSTSK